MGYYSGRGDCMYGRGDYYRGDYYRGDPGIFGSIGKALGGIARVAGAILPGPIGTVARFAGGILPGGKSAAQGTALAPAGLTGPFTPGAGIQVHGPFGTGIGVGTFGPDLPQQPTGTLTPGGAFLPGCQLKGFRPNKSSYFRAVPGSPMQGVLVPKGSVCVKSRRLNVANPRALRRAIRRAQGFAKLSRRVLSFVSAKAPKGRPKFRRKR